MVQIEVLYNQLVPDNPCPDPGKGNGGSQVFIILNPLLLAAYSPACWWCYFVFRSNLMLKVDFPSGNDWYVGGGEQRVSKSSWSNMMRSWGPPQTNSSSLLNL